jgi:integrase
MKIKFYLRNPKKKGVSAIYASICYNNNRVIAFPGESIHTSDWINKDGKNEPKANAKNATLIGNLFNAEKLYRDTYDELKIKLGGSVPQAIYKKAIADKVNPPEVVINVPVRTLIVDFFKQMIADSKSGKRLSNKKLRIQNDSIKPYNSTLAGFQEFEEKANRKFYMDEISQKLIDDFETYLVQGMKLALNTKSKYLQVFKLMIGYGKGKKLIDAEIVSDLKIQLGCEQSSNIYLNETEINDLMNYTDFNTPLYEHVRDLFVIGCKTGLRFCDFSRLNKEHINGNSIQIIQAKTNQRVTIPIHPIVANILLKYPDGLPKCPPNQVFNRYLKDIGEHIPCLQSVFVKSITRENKVGQVSYMRWQLLSSHTARRSFCTNEYFNGFSVLTIMAISGHKTQKSFMAYIKANDEEHAEVLRKGWAKINNK